MRGRIEERINSGSPECRPRTVPHHVGKAGYPTAARHRPTDPAHRRPEEEDRATDEGRAADDLRRARQPKPRRRHESRRDKNRGGGVGQGSRRNRCGAAGTACGAAAGGSSIVLRHLLRAVRQLIQAQPRVVGRGVAPPTHQVASDAADGLAVEQQLHLMFALLSSVRDWSGGRRRPAPREERLEAVDVDRRAAAHLTWQGEGVRVRARASGHRERAVPPRA